MTTLTITITADQCRAGRALLDWSQDQLSQKAQVARATIADFERNVRTPMRQNLLSIMAAFEAAGIDFIPNSETGEGVGVRFRKVELEYNRTLRSAGDHLVLSVRYKGKPYAVIIGRAIIDDIEHLRQSTEADRLKATEKHLPKILCAAEERLRGGRVTFQDRIDLSHDDFPVGTF
jgi:transcriptional regulator with XRE-family HTH domain